MGVEDEGRKTGIPESDFESGDFQDFSAESRRMNARSHTAKEKAPIGDLAGSGGCDTQGNNMPQTESYLNFLEAKSQSDSYGGFDPIWMPDFLFNFQKSLVDWSVRKGRASIMADCMWDDIRMNRVLPFKEARGVDDEKHVHPLQLDVIERVVTLRSNPGETVLTPFMGVGSEVYIPVLMGRKGIGFELKDTYYRQAVRNVEMAARGDKYDADNFELMLHCGLDEVA